MRQMILGLFIADAAIRIRAIGALGVRGRYAPIRQSYVVRAAPCPACHRSPRGGTTGSLLAVLAEAGLAGPCAHSVAVRLLPMSPIVFANFFIPGKLALTVSDKPVLQFWK